MRATARDRLLVFGQLRTTWALPTQCDQELMISGSKIVACTGSVASKSVKTACCVRVKAAPVIAEKGFDLRSS